MLLGHKLTFFQDWLWDNKRKFLQRFYVFVSCTQDVDLGQTNDQSGWHEGLVVIPTPHSSGYVSTDDGAGRREAVVGQEHTARLQLQLERGEGVRVIVLAKSSVHCFWAFSNTIKKGMRGRRKA